MPNDTQLEDFIIKHKLNQALMANYLGIATSTFYQKLHKDRYNKFTDAQKAKLTEYLTEIGNEIKNICSNNDG